jgi:hypothetical protein
MPKIVLAYEGLKLKIPIFVSLPTALNKEQIVARDLIFDVLDDVNLEPRSVGLSDFANECPLKEVLLLAKHCNGGIILGFKQFSTNTGILKKGTTKQKKQEKECAFPTPWNQIEAGILFGLRLPLMVFKEEGIEGGVFDLGVTELFIHNIPMGEVTDYQKQTLKECIKKWQAKVQANYESV